MSHRGSHETFLHFSLQGFHLYSRYFHQDLHWGPFHSRLTTGLLKLTPTPSYSLPTVAFGGVGAYERTASAPSFFRAAKFGR